MNRLTRDEWALELASVTARRSTCCRRRVGCVLLDVNGHVLSTGYNGVAKGLPHCNEMLLDGSYPHACSGSRSPSGTNLDGCLSIHAEQNALLQCRDPMAIRYCYVTTSPCMTCTKLLLNTGCSHIIFDEEYPHIEAADLWSKAGRLWIRRSL